MRELAAKREGCLAGFTLIEMSIVLVVIGLVVGGVLVGQDLIRAAYVRAQISQIEKYNTAVNTFYGKYQALPGDMNLSTAARYGFTIKDFIGSNRGQARGQGDGNGLIEGASASTGFPFTLGQGCGETGFFWSDLTYANGMNINLIEGSFGALQSGFSYVTFGSCFGFGSPSPQAFIWPVAKLGNGNYVEVYSNNGANYFGLAIIPSAWPTGVANAMGLTYTAPGLNVLQAYAIDKKMDDGFPLAGTVTVNYVTINTGTNNLQLVPSNPAATGSYNATTCYDSTAGTYVTNSTINGNGQGGQCALSFQMQGGD